ncbi:MAG: Tad domain-containing protein [Salinarimonas sp.]|nr:Tad domain-containing protein [Salinarimonas sp.]
MSLITRAVRDERGGVAVIFGLAVIPIFAFAGFAMDYSRATDVRAAMQNAADSTALQAVMARQEGRQLDIQQTFMGNFHHRAELGAINVSFEWIGANRVRVNSDAVLPMTIGAVLRPNLDVGVQAVAEGLVETRTNENHFEIMDSDAADFNELLAYCYDPIEDERLGPLDRYSGVAGARTDFVKVADNDRYPGFNPPGSIDVDCAPHEEISYMMRNTRGGNRDPSLRDSAGATVYEFYSDTTRDEENPEGFTFNFGLEIVETILCRSLAECRTESEGGILPDIRERDRTPERQEATCTHGQYLFIGFEDRPPELGWSDRDYDDLRFVISCPSIEERRGTVRLVG